MKKLFGLTLIVAAMALMCSCNKENGNLGEGLFQPAHKVTKIAQGGTTTQTWNWGTSKLASINDAENGIEYTFAYGGDLLSNVTMRYADGQPTENIYYTYQGSLLSGIEIVEGSHTLMTMTVMHNADDHISSMNIDLSDYYLVQLARQMMGFGKKHKSAMDQVLSEATAHAIGEMTVMAVRGKQGQEKYTIANKHFDLTYVWEKDNIVKETLQGNVAASATIADVADAFDFGSLSSIINQMVGDEEWPLDATVNSVTTYTYDEKSNPFQYCWNDGVSAKNLSKNNVLSSTTTGAADGTITITVPETIPFLGGMSYPYTQTNDLGESHQYSYSYNKKKLPTTMTVDGKTYDVSYSD